MHGWHVMFPTDYIIYNINELDILSTSRATLDVSHASGLTGAWVYLGEAGEEAQLTPSCVVLCSIMHNTYAGSVEELT